MGIKGGNRVRQSASFRDPSGFLFWKGGVLYRQVNKVFAGHYDFLMRSGLYKELVDHGLLIPHREVNGGGTSGAHKTIQPEVIKFISYPYEWCFSELKDAALLTLKIQKIALGFGMSLRDASAYNIQFHDGRPVLIDTLSFEKYDEGRPWVAYRQFSEHFFAPLALMAHTDVRLGQLLRIYMDGVPLDLARVLLPWKTRLMPPIMLHVHLHAKAQKKYSAIRTDAPKSGRRMDKGAILGLVENLEDAVLGFNWNPAGTTWADYYDFTNYTDAAMDQKKEIVKDFLDTVGPKTVWDLGANDGMFSRIASDKGAFVVSSDIDPAAVEKNYRVAKKRKDKNTLPLVIDMMNPSPPLGWNNEERNSFLSRGPVDMVFALALIHHLAISNNIPLESAAEFFASMCQWLVIEFVPKEDSQAQILLSSRDDIFSNYTRGGFEDAFRRFFSVEKTEPIGGSQRIMYLMKKK